MNWGVVEPPNPAAVPTLVKHRLSSAALNESLST